MHRHSAWTILGVDPATQRAAEELAAHEGMSVGGLLQVLLAEYASSKCSRNDASALRQQLVPLFQEIVDAIGTAAGVLAQHRPVTPPRSAEPLAEERAREMPSAEEIETPSFQEIQDWLRRVDGNKTSPQAESKI